MSAMNNDENNILSPGSWFADGGRHFVVPVYQRLFTWEENPQFDRLLDDLLKWHQKQGDHPSTPYYLGIATVVKVNKKDEENTYILVDGQQRLTVIAILSALLRLSGKESQRKELCDPNNYLSYEARPQDRNALKFIFENKDILIETTYATQKGELVETSDQCKQQNEVKWTDASERKVKEINNANMKAFVQHIRKHWDKWGTLSCVLKDHLCLLISELPDAYKEDLALQNEYFEKMNSSGKQLEQHEVLKVRLCRSPYSFDCWNKVVISLKLISITPKPKAIRKMTTPNSPLWVMQ